MQKHFPIPDQADVEYVYDGLMHLGADIAIETIDQIIACNGEIESMPQPAEGEIELKHAPKIFKETCEINWNQPAKRIYDFIRGLSPYPGTWTNLKEVSNEDAKALVLKIFKTAKTGQPVHDPVGTIKVDKSHLYVATADSWLEILELQMPGKKRMLIKDFLNGNRDFDKYRVE
jgi:methionyl-tRNA formyltransferase